MKQIPRIANFLVLCFIFPEIRDTLTLYLIQGATVVHDFIGYAVRGYRSFGADDLQRIGPIGRVHLLVGQNNVGKSNAMRAFSEVVTQLRPNLQIDNRSVFDGKHSKPHTWDDDRCRTISLGFTMTKNLLARLDTIALPGRAEKLIELAALLFSSDPFTRNDENAVWIDIDVPPDRLAGQRLAPDAQQFEQALRITLENHRNFSRDFSDATASVFSQAGGDYENYERLLAGLRLGDLIPPAEQLDAVREIGVLRVGSPSDPSIATRTGEGLIEQIGALERPEDDVYDVNAKKYEDLTEFVRSVLDDESAKIEVPGSRTDLFVHYHGVRKPIANLGTGIGEIILLAAAATAKTGVIVCIEEPEIHLHPTLQRKLIRYLAEKTDNRYLITTHSASFLDAEIASVSHLTQDEDGYTRVDHVLTPSDHFRVVADLGNRASDLVQSNFVLWVEGPADRIYLKHWISKVNPGLVEGSHYSVMFYGGALLSHLTADDDEVDEFVKLTRINRNCAIVIDSDKSSETDGLNATKERVISEMEWIDSIALVTSGYTIENYVPSDTLKQCLDDRYTEQTYILPTSKWKSPLGKKFKDKNYYPSKVSVAKDVVAANLDWDAWPEDLREDVSKLAAAIAKAND